MTGCLNKPDSRSSVKPSPETDLIELNRSLITSDREVITDYISKSDLSFSETGTGTVVQHCRKGRGRSNKDRR